MEVDQHFHPFHENSFHFMKTGDWESCESFLKLVLRWKYLPIKVQVWSDGRELCGSQSLQIWEPKKASVGAYHKQCDTRFWQTGLSRLRVDRSTADSCCRELNEPQQLREGCLLSWFCRFCCGLTGRLCVFVSGSTEKCGLSNAIKVRIWVSKNSKARQQW